ncbi:MAG: hypothetical protein WBP58_18225 [Chitinophagaceae bacterium]
MTKKISRIKFIASLTTLPTVLYSFKQSSNGAQRIQDSQRPEPLDPKIVQDFVRLGHHDLEGVKAKLAEMPALLNATTDWGGGDFETALGGASHMGRKDIAVFLINSGARMDIFTAAMLGYTDLVSSMCATHPALLNSKGPHGITLLMHAQKGGEEAKQVVKFLNSKGIMK